MRLKTKIKLEPIVLAKSFLSLNAVAGCRNDCIYCYKHSWDFDNKFTPHQIFPVNEILDNLLDYPYYSPNVPLAIHNSATDPFQDGVKEITFKLLEGLENLNIKNIVGLITKEYISKEDLAYLESFKNIKPILFLTYSGLPRKFEYICKERRFAAMENFQDISLKKILYFRPLIKSVNDRPKIVNKIIKIGEKYFDCIVRSSIKLDVNAIEYMASKGVYLDSAYDIGLNIHDSLKRLLPDSREKVDAELDKAKIPVFKKTSCAVSCMFNQPDYNAHWIRENVYCTTKCPSEQKVRCRKASFKKIKRDEFEKLLERINKQVEFEINDNFISVPGKKLSCSDIKFLRMAIGFPVLAEMNGEYLTAEEQDEKYFNKDRTEIKKFLKNRLGITNY